MTLKQTIRNDLKAAMKEGDVLKRDTLRFLDSMIKNVEIEKKKREEGLDDEEIREVIARAIKQRKDSIIQYESGKRSDLAEKEKKELQILMVYMPEQLSEDVLRQEVKSILEENGFTSRADMGKAMGTVMAKMRGRADGQIIRKVVEEGLK